MVSTETQGRMPPATGTPSPGDEPDALFEEAHRRRRRRRSWIAIAVLLALVLTAGGLALAGAGGGPAGRRHGAGAAHHTTAARTPRAGASAPVPVQPAIQMMGQAGPGLAWAAGTSDLYVTADGGRQWRTLTPPNLIDEYVSDHVTAIDAIGPDDLWLVLVDLPGVVPFSQSADGSDRGQGIDRSTDGGKTWTFSALPGCIQRCGPIWLSFVDAQRGFAAVSGGIAPTSPGALLFATSDGGASWTPIATPPDLGSVSSGGKAVPQLVFTSAEDGWAVTSPSDEGGAPGTGGVLYRTTDGGRSWTIAPDLPHGQSFSLPTFFGARDGVMLANGETAGAQGKLGAPAAGHAAGVSRRAPAVYVTDDGGTSWRRASIPARVARAGIPPGDLASRFSAASAAVWKVDEGSLLATTTDAGRHWTTLVPDPQTTGSAAVFVSPDDGMAIGTPAHCDASYGLDPALACYPVLFVTADGGRTWRPAEF